MGGGATAVQFVKAPDDSKESLLENQRQLRRVVCKCGFQGLTCYLRLHHFPPCDLGKSGDISEPQFPLFVESGEESDPPFGIGAALKRVNAAEV